MHATDGGDVATPDSAVIQRRRCVEGPRARPESSSSAAAGSTPNGIRTRATTLKGWQDHRSRALNWAIGCMGRADCSLGGCLQRKVGWRNVGGVRRPSVLKNESVIPSGSKMW